MNQETTPIKGVQTRTYARKRGAEDGVDNSVVIHLNCQELVRLLEAHPHLDNPDVSLAVAIKAMLLSGGRP